MLDLNELKEIRLESYKEMMTAFYEGKEAQAFQAFDIKDRWSSLHSVWLETLNQALFGQSPTFYPFICFVLFCCVFVLSML